MPSRFASARSRECIQVAHVLTAPSLWPAANDNWQDFARPHSARHVLLRAALRHFAAHGPDAAERARKNAERAFFADNRDDYRHWLAICRALDQRMASTAQPKW